MNDVNYANWDWLPLAANEIRDYLNRLLVESSINAHDVSGRAKSISSFQKKCQAKAGKYNNPIKEVTDIVAARVITYSKTDRDRVCELIRNKFDCSEDRNPGKEKGEEDQGYDCWHFIVTSESKDNPSGWVISGGLLEKYFDNFGGLEIQVRTVAAHAWAEFEHARRYKGNLYNSVDEKDQETINTLFSAAADARRSLDSVFVAIDRLLANPSLQKGVEPSGSDDIDYDPEEIEHDSEAHDSITVIDENTLQDLLDSRYPDDSKPSEAGIQFGCELVKKAGFSSIEKLSRSLSLVEDDQVRTLMEYPTTVTQVRRLDDDLLAVLGSYYIGSTSDAGSYSSRGIQLDSRYDRLRNKIDIVGNNSYFIVGDDCPDIVKGVGISAARAMRELVVIVAEEKGLEAVRDIVGKVVRVSLDDMPETFKPDERVLSTGEVIFIATNYNRSGLEAVMRKLIEISDLDIDVIGKGCSISENVN
ncbi:MULTISPECIES: RelA/SpoT domain-containing protein [unclassified Corynebacterium]|uniref:GTP pyrophosphokinase n=1 Tax=unclassified Corynebacterium TaxID=2624378 RepID=UPI0029C9BD36|nr:MULTISPECIES: RelA/SpoT domain-containing protein [unclassified Corynebacterium]WPF66787.1 RelA/SpoT domain-containing protein [Corynebacterium sp. 22KM0430]WPF69275.1 RelA/SpoT domain-containing protein [Corynebacterium sp. 21KM1197]